MTDFERTETAAKAALRNAWLTWALEEVDALRARGLNSQELVQAFLDKVETREAQAEIDRRYESTVRWLLDPTEHGTLQ